MKIYYLGLALHGLAHSYRDSLKANSTTDEELSKVRGISRYWINSEVGLFIEIKLYKLDENRVFTIKSDVKKCNNNKIVCYNDDEDCN